MVARVSHIVNILFRSSRTECLFVSVNVGSLTCREQLMGIQVRVVDEIHEMQLPVQS